MSYTTNVKDSNVKFLNGLQSALNLLIDKGGATKGAFYLTSDTHRLYIGQDNGSGKIIPVPVNQGINTVETIRELNKEVGAFSYITSENVLAIYNGSQWVQINPDTSVSNFGVSSVVADNTATITETITSTNKDTFNATIAIKGAQGINVTAADTTDSDGNTVSTVTVTGDKYNLSSAAGATNSNSALIKLDSTNTANDTSVKISGGNNVTVTGSAAGIEVSAKDTTLKSVEAGPATKTGKTGFDITVKDTDNNSDTGNIDPAIKLGNNAGSYKFTAGVATLPVYTKTETDNLFKGLNAMVYRGTLGTGGTVTALPSSKVEIGDTYLLLNDMTINNKSAKQGDMIIARGTETNGVIGADLTWDIVPSGDDLGDTTYSASHTNNRLALIESTSRDEVYVIEAAGSGVISVTDVTPASESSTLKFQVSHGTVEKNADGTFKGDTKAAKVTQSDKQPLKITAVTGITRDNYGHVTGITTKEHTVVDTSYDLESISITASTNSAKTVGTITTAVRSTSGENPEKALNISSSSLQINTVAAGSASATAQLSIDMVWGSF